MEDTAKLIEKYKRELMELSRSAKPDAAARMKSPQIIGYVDGMDEDEFSKLRREERPDENEEGCGAGPEPPDTPDAPDKPPSDECGPCLAPEPQPEPEPDTPEEGCAAPDPPPDECEPCPEPEPQPDPQNSESEESGSHTAPTEYPETEYTGFSDFREKNSGKGAIIFAVSTAYESVPIENAQCVITKTFNGLIHEIDTLTTDSSGRTEARALPAPPSELSQHPENTVQPFALYDAVVTHKGFAEAVLTDIPVFDGVKSVQNVSMLPVSAPDITVSFNED